MIQAVGASCSHSRSERELGNGFPGASCSRSNQLSMLADRNFLASIQFALRRNQYQSQKPAGVSGSPSRILREERSFMSSRLPIFASSSEARTATLQSLLIAAIVITGLYVAREVLLPLALAILLSFVLTPALLFLRRLKIPRVVGVAIVVAFAFALIFSLGWTMSKQATQLAEDLHRYQHVLAEKISAIRKSATGSPALEKATEAIKGLERELANPKPVPRVGTEPI